MRNFLIPLACCAATALPAQQITRVSVPAIGTNLEIDYTSSVGNAYLMYYASNANFNIPVPGIGIFYLDPLFFVFYSGPVVGVHTRVEFIPNDTSLLGGCMAIQALNIQFVPPTFILSSNAVTFCFVRTMGKVVVADGPDASAVNGDLTVRRITDSNAGAPPAVDLSGGGLVRVAFEPITHAGQEGFSPLTWPELHSVAMAERHVDAPTVPSRDLRNPESPHMVLPNGFDLYVVRSQQSPKQFHLVSVSRTTGIAQTLSGSLVTDSGSAPRPPCMYRPHFAFTSDGSVAVAVIHDSTNAATPNVGPADRVVLIKTDPSQVWPNTLNVLDVSPLAGPDKLHTAYDGSLRIGAGRAFVAGQDPGGVTGNSALWHGPLSGLSNFVRVAVPANAGALPWRWDFGDWRMNSAGTVGIFAAGYHPTAPTTQMDCLSITNIGPALTPVVNQVTLFPAATRVQTPGKDGVGGTNLRAALAPDGQRAAFLLGNNNGIGLTGIAAARTNGADAGSVAVFTTAPLFGEVHWLGNSRLLYAAGASATTMDYYVRDVVAATTTPVTTAGDLEILGSFFSDNRNHYYFLRRKPATGVTNWVGIVAATGALFDVSGSEFAAGASPALRAVGAAPTALQLRRRPGSGQVVFICGKDQGAGQWGDDELWRFDAEAGGAATQVTANNATVTVTTLLRRIDDLVLQPTGSLAAFTQGIGTSVQRPEDAFVIPLAAGSATKLSVTPVSGPQGIGRGSVRFTGGAGNPGLCWVQGTDSRVSPVVNTVALWNSYPPMLNNLLVRLTAVPTVNERFVTVLGTAP